MSRIAVLGAGLLGAAVAAEYLDSGASVVVTTDRTPGDAAVERVRRWVRSPAAGDIGWAPSTAEASREADIVVECLPEDLLLKRRELTIAMEAAGDDALFCTNTSSLRVTDIAEGLPRPERLVGTHYLNPPPAFEVVEVVAAEATTPEVVERIEVVLRSQGKRPIRVADVPGFVINRLQFALLREAASLCGEGVVRPEDLDAIVEHGLARRWAVAGPFTVVALGGPALFQELAERLYPSLSNASEPEAPLGLRDFGVQLEQQRATVADRLAAPAGRAR